MRWSCSAGQIGLGAFKVAFASPSLFDRSACCSSTLSQSQITAGVEVIDAPLSLSIAGGSF